jgi:hypothetical protein
MKKLLLLVIIITGLQMISISQPYLTSTTFIKTYTKVQVDSILDFNGLPSFFLNNKFTVDIYKMNYRCKDAFDTLVGASGLLIIPRDSCDLPILSYSHGTISRKSDAPSRFRGSETLIGTVMASNGYIFTMPDYLGLGDGPGLHPYQHAKTEAYANIYMLKALKEYCTTNAIPLNGQLFLSGYSQGGHASMVTHRMIEKDFSSEFTVTASAPMSGAYDMSGVMVDVMLSDSVYAAPAYLPYLVLSWNPIYNLYANISDAFKVPYDTTLPPLFDGTRSLGYIEARMPNVPKLIFDSTELYRFTIDLTHPFRLALKDNDAYTNWTPSAPLRMYYCTADRQVNYMNALVAQDSLKAQGCTTCDAYLVNALLDHQECAQFALINAKSFMDSLKYDGCRSTSINNLSKNSNVISIYPNPTSESVSIDYALLSSYEVNIQDITGRVVYSNTAYENNNKINTNYLESGMYSVSIKSKNQLIGNKLLVIRK